MIVRSGSTRKRGMGVPYWDLPGANDRGYLGVPGGLMPLEKVAAMNNSAPPSAAVLQKVNAQRMSQITRGAVQNYRGGAFSTGGTVVRRGMRGAPRGLGDCLNAMQSEGICPDGSEYLGTLDSGGAAPSAPSLSFPWFTGSAPTPPPAAPSSSSNSLTALFASILPASFTTLQEAIAQPGQVVKTPTTLITGSGANLASIPGLTSVTSSPGLIIGIVVIGGLLFFGSKK